MLLLLSLVPGNGAMEALLWGAGSCGGEDGPSPTPGDEEGKAEQTMCRAGTQCCSISVRQDCAWCNHEHHADAPGSPPATLCSQQCRRDICGRQSLGDAARHTAGSDTFMAASESTQGSVRPSHCRAARWLNRFLQQITISQSADSLINLKAQLIRTAHLALITSEFRAR